MELSQEDLDLLRAWTRGDYMYKRERPQRLHQLYDELAEPAPELYRGEQHDFYEAQQDWVKGKQITRNLTSATEDPTQADVFVYDVMSPFDRPLRIFMQINGARGIPLNKYLGEHEFEAQGEWLISGTFRIDSVGKEGKDSIYVWLSPTRQARTAIAKQSWYRATNDISSLMEDETFVHLGTWQAATEARDLPSAMSGAESAYSLYRVDIDPKNPLPNRVHDDVANAIAVLDTYRKTGRWAEWWGERHSEEEYMVDWLLSTGRRYPEWQVDPDTVHELDAVYYLNDFEDAGSTSVMVRPSAVVDAQLIAEWDDDIGDWVPVHEAAGVGEFMLMGPGGTQQKNLVDNPYHDPSKMAKYHEAEQVLAEFEQLLVDEYGIYVYELEDWWPKHRVPLDDIIPTQTWLDPRKFDIGEEGRSPGGPGDAVTLKYGGDHFLIDGHHRYKKFVETEQDDMLVRVMDMDADLERAAYWAATWYNKNLSDQGVFVTR